MKLYKKENYKKWLFVPLIFFIVFVFLIFFHPGIEQGIDLKGGNQIILHYSDHRDYSSIASLLQSTYSLKEVEVSETKGITEYGLLVNYSVSPDLDLARSKEAEFNYNANIDTLKEESKALFQPLIEKGILDASVVEDISLILNKEDLKTFNEETLVLASDNFNKIVLDLVLDQLNLTQEDAKVQIREVAPTLGKDFLKSSLSIGITALVLLIVVVLLFFKKIIPSLLIIFSAFFDIFAGLSGMALFGLPLSLVTIPALLMLIGYSVDTDIMLTSRLLHEKHKDPIDSSNDAIKTGLTMTLTAIATMIVICVFSYLTQMSVVYEISLILVCGLVGDLIGTWLFNAPALISYVEKNKSKA